MGIFKLNGVDYMGGGGGGGNSNEETLSYAEYLALSEAEKTNGTNYYIYDINGDGQEFQPVIYSTDEREIGVWADGKPLYQKTVYFTNASADGSVPLGLANIDTIFVVNGKYDKDTPLPYVAANGMQYAIGGFFGGLTANTNVTWEIRRGSGGVATVTGFITVQYTKTTDQPGSGTWTPQGVPAVHYSTDEQIVGTWIDGSTLYEKTYTYTATSQIISTFDMASLDSGVSVKDIEASVDENGSVYSSPYIGYGAGYTMIATTPQLIRVVVSGPTWSVGTVFRATLRYTKS